ncbi:MAG: ferric reductase-like transmembrane domain-containing protein [Acholeplasmataceae bacterium]|nr:ferric reductase-like transmembrane domain-containing protein [Acholeplasmataceae bacterium]
MTIILGLTAILVLLSYLFYKPIRKYSKILYLFAIILGIISFLQEITIINLGYVGLSFFLIVMFMGVLEKSEIKKRLMGNRAEYAILGTIFSAVHGLKFIVFSIDFYFFWDAPINFYLGIVAFIICTPLFITSFMWLRKKLKGKTWKKLHQLSYLFYLLIALHLILITNQRMWFYIGIFSTYFILKGLTVYQKGHPQIRKQTIERKTA